MHIARTIRHLLTPSWTVNRAFPDRVMAAIEDAIARSESHHNGQIRFAIEHALDLALLLRAVTARERAVDVFAQQRVWDTEHNNGILIYLLLADRDVEIVADRGIHACVGADGWQAVCRKMEEALRRGEFERALLEGVREVGAHLERHFGRHPTSNELSDRPLVL